MYKIIPQIQSDLQFDTINKHKTELAHNNNITRQFFPKTPDILDLLKRSPILTT